MPSESSDQAPSHEDVKAAQRAAATALLKEIARRSRAGGHAVALLNLAEAYAWLECPDQPHGYHSRGPTVPSVQTP